MAKYLIQASYTADGVKGLLKEGASGRRKGVEEMLMSVDGRLEAFYYGFGKHDVFAIIEVPDNVTAAALSMAINASGAVELRSTPLLSVEEIDEATKKAVNYRAPGK